MDLMGTMYVLQKGSMQQGIKIADWMVPLFKLLMSSWWTMRIALCIVSCITAMDMHMQ
jgi:hypothetical protein